MYKTKSAPPNIPMKIPYAPNVYPPHHQVPIIIIPSSPILTTPVFSEYNPPNPASIIGIANLIAEPKVPLVVIWEYVSTWAIITSNIGVK